jgi:hypothetical protein
LQYYTQALQNPIENIETLLEEGLAIPKDYGIEFDLDALSRMDSKTQMDIATKGVSGSIYSPNEGRAKFNLKPVPGGQSPLAQQQMSLEPGEARPMAPAPASPAIGGSDWRARPTPKQSLKCFGWHSDESWPHDRRRSGSLMESSRCIKGSGVAAP